MTQKEALSKYVLRLADNSLILGHRISEWCGHGPVLEQDIAMTNIALDLIGQARNYFQYASKLDDSGKSEDDLAYLRDARHYYNLLLLEQPNGDFANTIMRQYFFDIFHYLFLEQLQYSKDKQLAAIAEKSLKEVSYHRKWSGEWVLRLGDGTETSNKKAQEAVDNLWNFTGEMFLMDEVDEMLLTNRISVDLNEIKTKWLEIVQNHLAEATLTIPENSWVQKGGKVGYHSEHLGFLLTELQYMQKTYPGQTW